MYIYTYTRLYCVSKSNDIDKMCTSFEKLSLNWRTLFVNQVDENTPNKHVDDIQKLL